MSHVFRRLFLASIVTFLFPALASAQFVYAVSSQTDELWVLDRNTGAATVVGGLGFDASAVGIGFDANGVLWGLISGASTPNALYTINIASGVATHVIDIDRAPSGRGMTWLAGVLYYIDSGPNELWTVNTATGISTLVGAIGFGGVASLTSTPAGALYAIKNSPTELASINSATGAGTVVGPVSGGSQANCAYDVASNRVLSVSGGRLFEIDPANGATTEVGPLGMSGALPGLAVLDAATPVQPMTWGRLKSLYSR